MSDLFPETVAPDRDEVPDERYTTRETLDLCRKLADVAEFTLDVAACEESHVAERWYGRVENGLVQPWHGYVWCNPPYSDIEPWVEKAWDEIVRDGVRRIAMLLPATRTEQPWWQKWVEHRREGRWPTGSKQPRGSLGRLVTHFLPTRIGFSAPGLGGRAIQGSAPFGCVLLVFRPPKRKEREA
jgi:phage N-6-adenine-methyltransferase